VALARLAEEARHDLRAFYLKIWLEDELAFLGRCPWQEDLEVVHEVCATFDVPLEVVPLQRAYHEHVIGATIAELEAGRTPSPDVLCNRLIKFGAFVDHVGTSCDLVASGHHARVDHAASPSRLLKGADPVKDQTYFLSQLTQDQLRRSLFPIGHLSKTEVRSEAHRLGLPNAGRPDSQGICFLGRVPYDAFVENHLGRAPGPIRAVGSGVELGSHHGLWFHTIGQRRGLGLSGGPWYVVRKDRATNTLWVTHRDELGAHARARFRIDSPHWIARPPQRDRFELRLRHAPVTVGCTIAPTPSGGLKVVMDVADPGVAPGQFAVLYDGDECLGGGAISWD
jgi:tRNA-specific 2-thiouridylase